MQRDKSPLYKHTSPIRVSNYQRKLDIYEANDGSTTNFLNESKENIQNSLAGGTRDVLLFKCKQAIEELHIELESEKKLRQQIEGALNEAEQEGTERDNELREMRYNQEKHLDEIRNLRSHNETLRRDLFRVEDHVKAASSKETLYNELQTNFNSVCKANSEMKGRLEDMSEELENRNKIIKQWNDTLGSVQQKIVTLERENNELKEEYEGLNEENRKLRRIVDESENTITLLQEKSQAIERLTQQLQKENKVIDSLREQNEELRERLQEQQRNVVNFNEENYISKLQIEERYLKEKEDLEESLKEKHKRRLNEVQDSSNAEIYRLKEAQESNKSEFYKMKSERDILKQEVVRLEDRLEKVEFESRKLSGTFASNYESLLKTKSEEIERLKGVYDEQTKLIASYEKIVEKEKADSQHKVTLINEQSNRFREEVLDLRTKNEYLNNKLKECQEELSYLRNEVHNTFTVEEEKQGQLVRKLADLEAELLDRNTSINTLYAQIDHIKTSEKRQVEEIDLLNKSKIDITEELTYAKNQVSELIGENDELREKQKDFYEILQGKINKISDELKQEREKKIHAQNLCKSHEEKIVELEAKLRGQKKLSAHQPDRSTIRGSFERGSHDSVDLMGHNYSKDYGNNRHEISYKHSYHHPEKDSLIRDKESSLAKVEHRESRRASKAKVGDYSFDQKYEITQEMSRRLEHEHEEPKIQEQETPEKVHHQFVNKFKSVIERLENKLERITAEIDSA